ncbi:MAG: ABC transporter substrate-binding protein [Candidatus Methylumidiphilus sp.]
MPTPRLPSLASRLALCALCCLLLAACGQSPNDPYPHSQAAKNILYTAFSERPKHLDPARSYSEDEARYVAQIYEPLLQYHYFKRPYTLEPLTAAHMPQVSYLSQDLRPLPENTPDDTIAFSEYDIHIKPGIRYQPHPALATDPNGQLRYHNLHAEDLADIQTLADFTETGSRELTAEDYLYAIKRLAHPQLHSPIGEIMQEHIVGLKALSEQAEKDFRASTDKSKFLALRGYALTGVTVLDSHHFKIRLNGKYPQFRYWLAMTFFAPVPWEADQFYQQHGMAEKNLSLDWYPVGTGPYMMAENNPNRRIVLVKNPNYHDDFYPSTGSPEDAQNGLLQDAGKKLPFIDEVVCILEKETIPYWNKFLQGYFDASGLSSDNFDQAISFAGQGGPELTAEMRDKNIRLDTDVETSSFYMGFNMLDPVVGGYSEAQSKLRRAIAIAVDYDEFIAIFANGRGAVGQGVLPPGIFGYQTGEAGINPYVFDWKNGAAQRKPLDEAKKLLAEAGYPDGVDAKTGQPLVLYYDVTAAGADSKASLNWYRKQFAKLGIQLVLRTTDYNQFQQKIAAGNAQLFTWGWNADYPDPENFFFLLHGANAKVGAGGENAANYKNLEYDKLFERMRNMDDGPERQAIIQHMQDILRHDSPWLFGYHPMKFALYHDWYRNLASNLMARNRTKYQRIDAARRAQLRAEWNQPMYWPVLLGVLMLVIVVLPAWLSYRKRQRATALL